MVDVVAARDTLFFGDAIELAVLALFVAMHQIARTDTVDGSSAMPEHVSYLLEALRDSGEFTLYRGHEPGEPASVLVVAPAAEQPSPHSLRQLEHACSLAADLLGSGGGTREDNRVSDETFRRTGAHILGKRMFEEGEPNWPEDAPFHTPVFVLTHEARDPWKRQGGTTFYFGARRDRKRLA